MKCIIFMLLLFKGVALSGELEERADSLITQSFVSGEGTSCFAEISSGEIVDEEWTSGLNTLFERVIPLGSMCATKERINSYFNPTQLPILTKDGHADLFDWMYISNYERFSEAFANELSDFFEIDDLEIGNTSAGTTLTNPRYHMHWNHLFDSRIMESLYSPKIDGDLTKEILRAIFPEIKRKMNYLKDKLISAKHSKTLYVVNEASCCLALNLQILIKLRDAIVNLRSGDRSFTILFVNREENGFFENIIMRKCEGAGWGSGDNARWKIILDEFSFVHNIWL